MKRNLVLISLLMMAPVLSAGCSNDDDEDNLAALLVSATGDVSTYQFYGKVDPDLTSSCGSTSTTSSSSKVSTTDDTTTTTTTSTIYDITSYYIFTSGESAITFNYPINEATMYLKYKYNSTRDSFSLTPLTTSTSTCYTTDYINCNGSSGNPTCETADSLKCGGTYAFIFVSENPAVTFQAQSGSLDWSKTFRLDSGESSVARIDMTFSMVSADGTFFDGEIECNENDL